MSPIPQKREQQKTIETKPMTFSEAIKTITNGGKVTKTEWGDSGYYGVLQDGKLMLHKPDGKFYDWIISDGDLNGVDWIEIN